MKYCGKERGSITLFLALILSLLLSLVCTRHACGAEGHGGAAEAE